MSEKDPQIALEAEPGQKTANQPVSQREIDPRTLCSRAVNRLNKAMGRDYTDSRGKKIVSLKRSGMIGSTTTINDGYLPPFDDETMKLAIDYLYASDDA
jgi:hypothetical protein